MGSLASGIFGLVAGDPNSKQEQELEGLSNYQTGVGEGLTTAGAGEEEDILSGDPTKIAQAEAPEISGQQGQIEGQRLQSANFGNRAGGTNAGTQDAENKGRGNIIDLTGNLISNTAGAAVGQGTNLQSLASGNINSTAGMKRAQQQAEQADVGGIATGAAEIASGIGGAGSAPTGTSLEEMGAAHGPLSTTESDTSNDFLSPEAEPQYQF